MKGITNNAGLALKEALDAESIPPDRCVRFVGSVHGGELQIDRRFPDDQVFKYGGRTVLAVGPETAGSCRRHTLDYEGDHFNLVTGAPRAEERLTQVVHCGHM
ncbi:MAG: hypothetical protein KAV82_09665 [Phycisphaerae bacterium]|nr:hypothetical protein [Phycisphaerae bacterium]